MVGKYFLSGYFFEWFLVVFWCFFKVGFHGFVLF